MSFEEILLYLIFSAASIALMIFMTRCATQFALALMLKRLKRRIRKLNFK